MSRFTAFVVVSVLLHSLVLLLNIKDVSKKDNKEVPNMVTFEQPDIKPVISDINSTEKCNRFYIGIGISHLDLLIVDVFIGQPAYLAGIRINDYILNSEELNGEENTPAKVVTMRGEAIITYNIVRKKICY